MSQNNNKDFLVIRFLGYIYYKTYRFWMRVFPFASEYRLDLAASWYTEVLILYYTVIFLGPMTHKYLSSPRFSVFVLFLPTLLFMVFDDFSYCDLEKKYKGEKLPVLKGIFIALFRFGSFLLFIHSAIKSFS